MGMELYNTSPAAKGIWDSADAYLLKSYVRCPSSLCLLLLSAALLLTHRPSPSLFLSTGFLDPGHCQEQPQGAHRLLWRSPRSGHPKPVHVDGVRGRDGQQGLALPRRQRSLAFVHLYGPDRSPQRDPVHPGTPLFLRLPSLSAAHFAELEPLSSPLLAQIALVLVAKASFVDLSSRGLIQPKAPFGGHSLGEYAALASVADVLPVTSLCELVFYRVRSFFSTSSCKPWAHEAPTDDAFLLAPLRVSPCLWP
jgi:malonyl CoA-acyl carrier protein transacylase